MELFLYIFGRIAAPLRHCCSTLDLLVNVILSHREQKYIPYMVVFNCFSNFIVNLRSYTNRLKPFQQSMKNILLKRLSVSCIGTEPSTSVLRTRRENL